MARITNEIKEDMCKQRNEFKEDTNKQLTEHKENSNKQLNEKKTMLDMKEEFNKIIEILKKSN
jgi:hypothetical protein